MRGPAARPPTGGTVTRILGLTAVTVALALACYGALAAVLGVRRRNGATSWRVFRDLEEEGRFVERYIIASWAEYMRLRTRMTMADRRLVEHVQGLQRPDVPMRVSRFLGINREDPPREHH